MENTFQWTDELVAEYSLQSQKLTIWDFKRLKQKEETYLFTTTDGIKKYEGDNAAFVDTKKWEVSSWSCMPKPLRINNRNEVGQTDFSHYKFFDNHQTAKEWLKMNRPFLSAMEVNDIIREAADKTNTESLSGYLIHKFYNLAIDKK